jgi:predicted nucleic acid-binding protein
MVSESQRAARGPRLNAADTSSLRRYWAGADGADVRLVDAALDGDSLVVPPVVITELLSDPASRAILPFVLRLRLLDIQPGYWLRAGDLRARMKDDGRKAGLADTLIAQACIDHDIPLITHDRDFRHFVKAGLKLL